MFDKSLQENIDLHLGDRIYTIDININQKSLSIFDNCGGISYDDAKHSVFRFGRASSRSNKDTLSVYGVGLKRALFKIGDQIDLTSNDGNTEFLVSFSAKKWEKNKDVRNWTLPLEKIENPKLKVPGTTINISNLTKETLERVKNPTFLVSLRKRIKETYSFYNKRFCKISVNREPVASDILGMAFADGLNPTVQHLNELGCRARIIAGLAPRRDDKWLTDHAGWYIFCNGRAVVYADRSKLTGWDNGGPKFVSKFRGFYGLVFLFAKNPENLPWTTTKTDINEESLIYQRVSKLMLTSAKPVLRYLNSLYGTDEVEAEAAKIATDSITEKPLSAVLSLKRSTFTPPTRAQPTKMTIQYSASLEDLDKIRTHLRRRTMSGRRIGEMTFRYYLENEVVE